MARPRKTRSAKALAGNPGKRPLQQTPVFGGGPGEPPDFLDAEAKREWHRVCAAFASNDLLTEADRGPLAILCQAWSRVVSLEKIVRQVGEVLVQKEEKIQWGPGAEKIVNEKIVVTQSPHYRTLLQEREIYLRCCREFGLTPASRTRLDVEAVEEGGIDAFDRLREAMEPSGN